MQQAEESKHHKGIEEQGNDRAYREGHVTESQQDVEEDGNQSDDHTDECTTCDGLSHRRSHLCSFDDGGLVAILVLFKEFLFGSSLGNEASLYELVVQDFLSTGVNLGIGSLDVPVGRHTNGLSLTQGNNLSVGFLTLGLAALLVVDESTL